MYNDAVVVNLKISFTLESMYVSFLMNISTCFRMSGYYTTEPPEDDDDDAMTVMYVVLGVSAFICVFICCCTVLVSKLLISNLFFSQMTYSHLESFLPRLCHMLSSTYKAFQILPTKRN